MPLPLLQVEGLKKYYPVEGGFFKKIIGYVRALDDVTFTVYPQESFGVVGESGCGKTTLARTILRLEEPTAGSICLRQNGTYLDIGQMEKKALRKLRAEMQMVFQDPQSSLNSRMTIGQLIREPLLIHKQLGSDNGKAHVEELIKMVGLSPQLLSRFPHELSGGQRQRIGIARALALSPRLVICDEAVSALDVSVRAQILNLLKELQTKLGLTYIFISHDLSVVRYFCNRVAVMYLGQIVELAPVEDLFAGTRHPYSVALISAVPVPKLEQKRKRVILTGDVPSPVDPPAGCRFHPRCWLAKEICRKRVPLLQSIEGNPRHFVACHRANEMMQLVQENHAI